MAAGCVIGVDLGGTKLFAGTVDSKLEVHHRAYRLARPDDTGVLIDQLVETVQEAIEAASGEVLAVGLGIPCLVDPRTGIALDSNHLPLRGVAVRDVLAERLGLPVAVDNDANAAMLAEWRCGEARGTRNAIMLTLGTGIGGGLIVEGLRVARETPDSALGRALRSGRDVTGALVTELAHDGDPAACDVMTLMGRRLGLGIVTLVNIFNPEVVVVGGGAIAAGELLLAPAREVIASRALPINREDARLVPARFGAESGMLGAACMALDVAGIPVA